MVPTFVSGYTERDCAELTDVEDAGMHLHVILQKADSAWLNSDGFIWWWLRRKWNNSVQHKQEDMLKQMSKIKKPTQEYLAESFHWF